jgi:hypothetical protein
VTGKTGNVRHGMTSMRIIRRTVAVIFVLAVAGNYVWEIAQSPLYEGMGDLKKMLPHCFVASLGDGLLLLVIFAVGWATFRRSDWFVSPGRRGYFVMLVVGLVIGVVIEWAAVHLVGRWAYTPRMPPIPLLNVGLTPIAQMLILPPLVFRVTVVWYRRTAMAGSRGAN